MKNRIERIRKIIDEKKGEDIEIFDLSGKDYIVDFVVIATAMASKHSFALLDSLKSELKANGEHFYATEEETPEWVIADLGDIMIHIFTQEHRAKFNLEEFLDSIAKQKPL